MIEAMAVFASIGLASAGLWAAFRAGAYTAMAAETDDPDLRAALDARAGSLYIGGVLAVSLAVSAGMVV